MPNSYEAREAAWLEWYRVAKHQPFLENVETGFTAGWDARGGYDEQRIAELVEALREIAHMPTTYPTRMVEAMESIARRALGQLEEVKP